MIFRATTKNLILLNGLTKKMWHQHLRTIMRWILFRKAFPWSRSGEKELPKVEISGVRVILREKSLDDFVDEYAWRIDEELSRLDATRPLKMSYDEYYRYASEELQFPTYRSKRLAIDTLEGVHIGNVMYYDFNSKKMEVELGIMIGDKSYWDRGYGTDAVDTLLNHLFSDLEMEIVYLHTLVWNIRAQGSFAKSGFREVRSVRKGGQDFIRMEIKKDEWENYYSDSP